VERIFNVLWEWRLIKDALFKLCIRYLVVTLRMNHIPSLDVFVLLVALCFIFSYQKWAVVDLSEFEDFFPWCGLQVLYCFLLLFSQ